MGAFLGSFFSAVLAKFVGLATFIGALMVAAFAAWWLLGTDLAAWVVEQMLDAVIAILGSIEIDTELFNPGSYISALPPEITNMLGIIRIGEALAIISAAIVAKVLLQLIPFTRLGS